MGLIRNFQTVSLQRQSKALTRIRSWSRCERSLLGTPETKSRFNRYDQRCRCLDAERSRPGEPFVGPTRSAAATLVKAVQEETAPPTQEGGVLFAKVVRQR